jgi:hypothetical protein
MNVKLENGKSETSSFDKFKLFIIKKTIAVLEFINDVVSLKIKKLMIEAHDIRHGYPLKRLASIPIERLRQVHDKSVQISIEKQKNKENS